MHIRQSRVRLINVGYKLVDVVARDAAALIPVSPTWTRTGYELTGIVPHSHPHTFAFFEDLLPSWSFVIRDRQGNESPVLQLGDGFHPQGATLTGWQQLAPAFGVSKSAFYEIVKQCTLLKNAQGDYIVAVLRVAMLYYRRCSHELVRRQAQPRDAQSKHLVKGKVPVTGEIVLASLGRWMQPFEDKMARDLIRYGN